MTAVLPLAVLVVLAADAGLIEEAPDAGLPPQALNAKPVVDAGGALLVEDAAFSADYVADTVPALATDRDRLAAMGAAAAHLVPRDADDKLARIIQDVAR